MSKKKAADQLSQLETRPAGSDASMMGKFPRHEVENAYDTIKRAHKHLANPEMAPHIKKLAQADQSANQDIMDMVGGADSDESEPPKSLAGLKALRNKKSAPPQY